MRTIGTHDGRFHCDEALACALLRSLDEYKDASIIRTRDPRQLQGCDILVDVGEQYDPKRGKFDHHQRGFQETFAADEMIPLSSAGLVYKEFGLKVIAGAYPELSAGQRDWVFARVYQMLIKSVDAIDNGVNLSPAEEPLRYMDYSRLSSRIMLQNRPWNVDQDDTDKRFAEAIELADSQFRQILRYVVEVLLPARDLVQQALCEQLRPLRESYEFLVLPCALPWEEFYNDFNYGSDIAYVIWPGDDGKSWCIQSLRTQIGSFTPRYPFPSDWRGVSGHELATVTGVAEARFCHRSGFFAVTGTYDSAIQLMNRSFANPSPKQK
jgi:uncharacterized UPF0160 family protein